MSLFKKVAKVAKKVISSPVASLGLGGITGLTTSLGKKAYDSMTKPIKQDQVPGVDPSFQASYDQIANNPPKATADVEQFYTPQLQQSIMNQLRSQAGDQNAMDQAAISGGAVGSGFGFGGTSREAARRAKADSNMMDSIIQGSIGQAQQIQDLRTAQTQDQASKELGAQQTVAGQRQGFQLGQQGFNQAQNLFSQQQGDIAQQQRQQLLFSGIGGLAGGAGSLFGAGPRQPRYTSGTNPTGYISPYSKLSLYGSNPNTSSLFG